MIDIQKLPVLVEVDGGVSPETVGEIAAAGADVLVSGSGIFGGGDIAANVRRLRELMK
jgi:ribulose-phosphate 3-epimerase